tara:strand:- start:601 stop:1065 length:465 start_codon:yes stop_codon:yes gene_type:complete
MKLKIGNNFSFLNLLRYVITNPEFGETVNTHITDKIVEDSKSKIRENRVKPRTTDATLKKRRARKNPPTISDSTLYDTGKLHDSIKLTNAEVDPSFQIFAKTTKNIEFIEYGKYHQFKGLSKKRREFIEVKRENLDKAEEVIVKNFNKAMRRKR